MPKKQASVQWLPEGRRTTTGRIVVPSCFDVEVFRLPFYCWNQRWNRNYSVLASPELLYPNLFFRGGCPYHRPFGWFRYSLNVSRHNAVTPPGWLGPAPLMYPLGIRIGSHPSEWAVTYHGTSSNAVASIVLNGYSMKPLRREMFGKGIYSSPDIKVAERFCEVFWHCGRRYKVVLQNRVDPFRTKFVLSRNYCISAESAIVPYGVLIRELRECE